MANILEVFSHWFHKLFGWVIKSDPFKELVAHLLPVAVDEVTKLASIESLSSADKRAQAISTLAAAAKAQGLTFADHMLGLLVEMAVASIKGTIGPA